MRRLRGLGVIAGLLLFAQSAIAQSAIALTPDAIEADDADREAFAAIVTRAEAASLDTLPYSQRVQALALDPGLQGHDYSRGPLERDADNETLYAGFGGFDCVTFVETVVALADTVSGSRHDFGVYAEKLATWRYRDGEPAYCGRLHYFSDWIRNGVASGRLDDVTAAVAGSTDALAFAAEPQGFNYLSRHASDIPALANSVTRQACVLRAENDLGRSLAVNADRVPGFTYIPKVALATSAARLQGGDIVAWVAEEPGLDVVHVGIVIRRTASELALAHASLRKGRIAIAPDLLAYSRTLPKQRGLLVLRPRSPAPERQETRP